MRYEGNVFWLITIFVVVMIIFGENITGLATSFVPLYSTINFQNSTMTVSPLLIEVNMSAGTTVQQNFDITSGGSGNTGLNVTIEKSGTYQSFITLNETYSNVSNAATNTVSFDITIPSGQTIGYYTAFINVTDQTGNRQDINVTIYVNSTQAPPPSPPPSGGGGGGGGPIYIITPEQPLVFDTVVEIQKGYEEVAPGSPVYAIISATRYGGPNVIINANLNYSIRDFSGNRYVFKSQRLAIGDNRTDIYYLVVPSRLPFGTYVFEAFLEYQGSYDVSQATFDVVPTVPPPTIIVRSETIPVLRNDEQATFEFVLENTEDTIQTVNATLYLPLGINPKNPSLVTQIVPNSTSTVSYVVTPHGIAGLYEGYISITYGGHGFTHPFQIWIVPSPETFLLILFLIIAFLILVYITRHSRRHILRSVSKRGI